MNAQPLKKIVVLASGSGFNCQVIIDACAAHKIAGEVVAVITNRPNAGVLALAENAGIANLCIDHTLFDSRESFDRELQTQITQYQADLVVLAGFMRILTSDFVANFSGRMLNIHPSLLPKYPGLNTHQKALDNQDCEHGVSVHFVTSELDGGPVVLQAKVPVFEDDDVASLAQRVQQQEHQIYPLVVNWFCRQRLTLQPDGAYLDNQLLAVHGYASDDQDTTG